MPKFVWSICPYCGTGCGIKLKVEDNKVVAVEPSKEHPVSKGELCIKGATVDKVINHPERLKKPLIKKKGKFVESSWEEALNLITEKFTKIKETYGSNSIGIFASAKCTNEECYLTQKFARIVIGTNNVDNCARLCHAPSTSALAEVLKKSAMTNSFEDLSQSNCILIFGSNPAETQPIGFNRLLECKKYKGKIVVIDVLRTSTADKADIFLQINPGSDTVLVAGMIKAILEEKLESKKFISQRTNGFDELKKSVEKYSWNEIEKITGIEKEKIREIALLYAKSDKAAIINGMGITQKTTGVENALCLADLMLLIGHVGKPGSGINPLRGCNNVQGCCDMGCLPDLYPGYTEITEENIRSFEKIWKVKDLPIKTGLTEVEMIAAIPEKIVCLYVIGENPMISHPNLNEIEENLKNLEFLVVQDVFLTETAQLADVVLPAAIFAEKRGTFTSLERRVQLANKAVDPKGEAKEDLEIIILLAQKLGFKDSFDYKNSEEVFEEIRKCVPQYSGITYNKLRIKGIQWPCDEKNPNGTKFLFENDFFGGKKATFYPIAYRKFEQKNDYPFYLITHRTLEQYNTGTFSRRVDVLNKIKPENLLEINKRDAYKLSIKDGDLVKLISEYGEMKIKVKISHRVKEGVVATANHFTEMQVNRLISSELDPVSKTPEFKKCRVKIEK